MRQLIEAAMAEFVATDKQLLGINESDKKVHEIAVAHRLAIYLEKGLADESMSVDLEYNKHGINPKRIDGKLVRPDIVVHQRGNDANNLIVIEVKKSEHTKSAKDFAIEKIRGFCDPDFNYKHGYVIEASAVGLRIVFDKDKES